MQIHSEGSGPALVLVHSLLTDSGAFDVVAPTLAQNRRVIRVSLPGYGESPPLPMEDPSIFDLADAVAEAMAAAHAGSEAAVLGNGLGAFVVAALAVKHGNSFGPLISANGGAGFAPDRRAAFTTMSDLVTDGGMEAVVNVAVNRIFTPEFLQAHPSAFEERRRVLMKANPSAFAAACRALRDMDLSDQVARIQNPTLVIAGGADQTTPPEMARQLADAIPDASFVELEGCGHCPPLEQPDAFVHAVESFLGAL